MILEQRQGIFGVLTDLGVLAVLGEAAEERDEVAQIRDLPGEEGPVEILVGRLVEPTVIAFLRLGRGLRDGGGETGSLDRVQEILDRGRMIGLQRLGERNDLIIVRTILRERGSLTNPDMARCRTGDETGRVDLLHVLAGGRSVLRNDDRGRVLCGR